MTQHCCQRHFNALTCASDPAREVHIGVTGQYDAVDDDEDLRRYSHLGGGWSTSLGLVKSENGLRWGGSR